MYRGSRACGTAIQDNAEYRGRAMALPPAGRWRVQAHRRARAAGL